MPSPLDNPIWSALSGPHAPFAESYGPLLAYPEDVAPFCGFREREEGLEHALNEVHRPIALFRLAPEPAPPGWRLWHTEEIVQMILSHSDHFTPLAPDFARLGPADADEVFELIKLTKPGPFEAHTMHLGSYVGISERGQLVALAGERLRLDDYVEVSAVCTHPDMRGRGYAGALVNHLAQTIFNKGSVPFLHVMAQNETARRVYERLGFTERARLWLSVWIRES